ncbi:MAG: hypothetical protein HY361_00220 [Candidatus Aenigmarchaeota archaeon]|nr:hypothetical protein [Candidatus Aenigmarchaeota archaeon]
MKGQSSFEMIMMTAIVLGVFLFALVWYFTNNADISKSSKILKARGLCSEITDIINSVSSAGNNAKASFTLPSSLESSKYNLTIFAQTKVVYTSVNNVSIYCSILTPNVTNGTHSNFSLKAGDYNAKNIFGVVNINAK